MLVVYLLFSLLYLNCRSESILSNEKQLQEQSLIMCITNIVKKYFSEEKSLTYVDMKTEADEILKAIHSSTATAVVYRQATKQSYLINQGYLISSKTATKFTQRFKFLLQEPTWNPYARFLIVINSVKDDEELKMIFDELLQRYVINVIVVNGTKDPEIYAYNPYENYGCGKYYDEFISYGLCSKTKENLFPDKLVTGLRNCTIVACVGDRPPYSIQPSNLSDTTPGTEQYIFKILAEIEQFNVNFTFDYDKRLFTIITKDMQVIGPMEKLLNETDVMFGCSVLVASRADAFAYLHGHVDYDDELWFLVKRASFKAIWKSAYLEFQPFVWCLLVILFLLNSTIMVFLLRAKDKIEIVLKLLKSLLLHGFNIPERRTVKFFFIIWVWFAYIMNSIYQSSLVSLTTNPVMERQVLTETDLVRYNLKPCISPAYVTYIYSETNISSPKKTECLDNLENVKLVSQSEDLFTLVQQSFFKYYEKSFNDEFGRSPVYLLKKPYAKLIFGYFFRKGFPVSDRMRKNVIRIRETGLVEKNLKDHYYTRAITYHFHKKGFETRFVIPWWMYVVGCFAASVVFIFELLLPRYKKHIC